MKKEMLWSSTTITLISIVLYFTAYYFNPAQETVLYDEFGGENTVFSSPELTENTDDESTDEGESTDDEYTENQNNAENAESDVSSDLEEETPKEIITEEEIIEETSRAEREKNEESGESPPLVNEGSILSTGELVTGQTGTETESLEEGLLMLSEMNIAPQVLAYSPGGVAAGLSVWTKADDAGCSVGSSCASWKDNSANANDVETVGTMTLQQPNAVHNFQPYFTNFSSNNHFRDTNSFTASLPQTHTPLPHSVYIVARPTTNREGRMFGMSSSSDAMARPGFSLYNEKQHYRNYSTDVTSNTTYTVGQTQLFGYNVQGGAWEQRLNAKSFLSATAKVPEVGKPYMNIGYGTYGHGGEAFHGDIQEVIFYSGNLSVLDQKKVESYLAIKYGITLSQTDYLSSNGATIFSNSANAGYTTNIIGIGRDTASALHQKQSTSANGDILTIGNETIDISNSANTHSLPNQLFLFAGSNDDDLLRNFYKAPDGRAILARQWKLQSTQPVFSGLVLRVPDHTSTAVNKLPATSGTVYALFDDDGDFSAGAREIALTLQNGYREGTVNYTAATPYLTFAVLEGTPQIEVAPGGVTKNLTSREKADNAGCTPGTACASWKDHSPYGNNVNTVGSMTLQIGDSTHNYHPYFTNFSSNNHFQHQKFQGHSGATHYTKNQTAFAVVRPTSAGEGTIVGIDYYSHYAISPRMGIQGGKQMFVSYYPTGMTPRPSISPNALPLSQSSVLSRNADESTITQRMNAEKYSASVNRHHESYGQYYTIGYGEHNTPRGAGMGAFPGDIQEVIWYEGSPTALEIQKIESYLAIKYGVTLSGINYLASNRAIVWNANTNPNYNKNLIGIGRDDVSSLLQKQSTTVNTPLGYRLTLGLNGEIAATNSANSQLFSTDRSFLLIGDNGGDGTPQTTLAPNNRYHSAINQAWHLQRIGAGIKSVKIQIENYAGIASTIPIALLDDDGDFTNGGTIALPMTVAGNTIAVEIPATTFQPYFTIANKYLDTEAPVIHLSGNNPQYVEVHTPYIEAGANVTDNYDTNLTATIDTSEVKTGVLGTYRVYYTAVDSGGNKALTGERTVIVRDTTAPILTLKGNGNITLEVHSSYTDEGANWVDNYDGTGTVTAYTGSVDTGKVGTYTLEYRYVDSSGNMGNIINRKVHIVDTTKPSITLNGANPNILEVGKTYIESGAKVNDNYDSMIQNKLIISGNINTNKVGSYYVSYNVTDSEGNVADEVIRTVIIQDTESPTIILNGNNPQYVEVHTPYIEAGASVTDNYDTNLTAIIDTSEVKTGVIGTYRVYYTAVDSEGNQALTGERTVIIRDTTAPILTLNGNGDITLEVHSSYTDEGANWVDNYDGTGTVKAYTGSVDTGKVGVYTLKYHYIDSSGNIGNTVKRKIHIVDTTAPILTLNGSGDITLEVHSSYIDQGANWRDNYDGTGIVYAFSGTVNTGTVGDYVVEYRYIDANGNTGNVVSKTIHIVDTTAPILTLNGSGNITLEVHSSYTDEGANWVDNYDGTGTMLAYTGSVDTGKVGTYTLEYRYVDNSGNTGNIVSRTVHIVDTTKPSITLNGTNPQYVEVHTPYIEAGASVIDNYDTNLTATIDTSEVKTGVLGTYRVYYTAVDSEGNQALTGERTVIVRDTTAPILTLNGSGDITLEVHSSYIDQGVNWTDNYDGTGIVSAFSGMVNTGAVGDYVLAYSYTDTNGNTGNILTRTIHIVDTTKPIITLNGAHTVILEIGKTYIESGATLNDNYDTNIQAKLIISGNVNTGMIGTYYLYYNATDDAGNIADEVIRTIIIQNTGIPVIILSGDNPQYVEVHTPYLEAGASVSDSYGTSLTAIIDVSTVNTGALGTYYAYYTATDSFGNNALTGERIIVIRDTTAPILTLNGSGNITLEVNSPYTDEGANWVDNYDGTGMVTAYTGSVDTGKVGTYPLEYRYIDSSGNTGNIINRKVHIVDTTKPSITLNGTNPQYVEVHTSYIEAGASVTDNYDKNLTATIDASEVKTGMLGTYRVYYTAVDSEGNQALTGERQVIVRDTIAPILTLNGSRNVTLNVNTPYTDEGANWVDNYDGTGMVTAYTGSVDTGKVGTYTLEYRYVDSSGNMGNIISRTVHIVNTIKPNIILNGANPQYIEVHHKYEEKGVMATNMGGKIQIDNFSVNTGILGTYYVYYTATGHTPEMRKVIVQDTTKPIITLSGGALITLPVGGNYTEYGALVTDNYDTGVQASLTIGGKVNTTHPGIYLLTYTATDSAGNSADTVIRTVIVQQPVLPPSIGRNGQGGGFLAKDYCPNGDESPSYYDGSCGTPSNIQQLSNNKTSHNSSKEQGKRKKSEFQTAYQRAYQAGITTMDTYETARMTDAITRAEMAKMIVKYVLTPLHKGGSGEAAGGFVDTDTNTKSPLPPFTKGGGETCTTFSDLDQTTTELQEYILNVCQLGLMGYYANGIDIQPSFRPNDTITRAEVGVILSRLLRSTTHAGTEEDWYQNHLSALNKAGIMKHITDPRMRELRGNVMLMLMRMGE